MRDGDIDAHAPVQERVRDVPVIIAEVPRHVLAVRHDEHGPAEDERGEKQPFCWREPGSAGGVV